MTDASTRGNQDRAASGVRPGCGQGGVHRAARYPTAGRLVLLHGVRRRGPALGLVPGGGPQGMTSPVAYWGVPDIEAKLAEVTAAGGTVHGGPARGRWRTPGGELHRPRRQRARPRAGRMREGTAGGTRTDLIRVHGARREQPQRPDAGDPKAPADGVHRRFGLGQELARVRHDRGGVAAADQQDVQQASCRPSCRRSRVPRSTCLKA